MYELGIVSDSGGQGGGPALNLRAPWRSRYLHHGRWPGHSVDEHDQPHTLPPSLVFGVFVVFYSVPCVSINALDRRLSSQLRQIRALTGMSAAGVWRKEMASTCTEMSRWLVRSVRKCCVCLHVGLGQKLDAGEHPVWRRIKVSIFGGEAMANVARAISTCSACYRRQ